MRSSLKATLATVMATGIAAVSLAGFAQTEQKFPSKPVRLVTGGAGSQNDIVARLIGMKLSEGWGQPVVVEKRMGAIHSVPAINRDHDACLHGRIPLKGPPSTFQHAVGRLYAADAIEPICNRGGGARERYQGGQARRPARAARAISPGCTSPTGCFQG